MHRLVRSQFQRSVRRSLLVFVLVFALGKPASAGDHELPDPQLTPGDAIPNVTAAEVCTPGFARSVRRVSLETRRDVFAEYGLQGNHTGYCGGPQGCEVDHLISLELGGSN